MEGLEDGGMGHHDCSFLKLFPAVRLVIPLLSLWCVNLFSAERAARWGDHGVRFSVCMSETARSL